MLRVSIFYLTSIIVFATMAEVFCVCVQGTRVRITRNKIKYLKEIKKKGNGMRGQKEIAWVENYQQFYSHVHSTETERKSSETKRGGERSKKGGENCSRRKDLNAFMFLLLLGVLVIYTEKHGNKIPCPVAFVS